MRSALVCAIGMVAAVPTIASGAGGSEADGIIPAERRTTWNPGIPGGVPVVANIHTTIKATYGNGTIEAGHAINRAIQEAGDDATSSKRQVVYLPPGTYRTTVPILMNRSNVVLRGAGPRLTKIRYEAPGSGVAAIRMGWKWDYTGVWDVVGSVPKGSTRIAVTNAGDIEVGDVIQIDQQDDPKYVTRGDSIYRKRQPVTDANGPGTGGGPWRSVGQQVEVASKKGNVLGLSGPTHIAFDAALRPQVFKTATARSGEPGTRYAGIEDLYVAGGNNDNIALVNVAYCWVKNIESDGNPLTGPGVEGEHVGLAHAYRCEIRDSYFHHARSINQGGSAYGISISNQSSDNLVENNICVHLNKPILMNASGGGNVIAYNYVDNAYSVGFAGWQENSIDGNHECFSHYDLFEGNWSVNIGSDSTHGNSGWQTFFRNYAPGRNSEKVDLANVRAVGVDGWSREHNFVGNVLLQPNLVISGHPPVYECTAKGPCMSTAAVYRIGANALGGPYGAFDDGTALRHLLRHGNFDYVTNRTIWDPGIPSHDLPPSLYLKAKPAFFGDELWPFVDPDRNPKVGILPAKKRYESLP